MKKLLSFILFIFLTITGCLCSFESNDPITQPDCSVQVISNDLTEIITPDLTTKHYIANSNQFNISQLFSNSIEDTHAKIEHNNNKKFNSQIIFKHQEIFNINKQKIAYSLNPRAP